MPGLRLGLAEACSIWQRDEATCAAAIKALERAHTRSLSTMQAAHAARRRPAFRRTEAVKPHVGIRFRREARRGLEMCAACPIERPMV